MLFTSPEYIYILPVFLLPLLFHFLFRLKRKKIVLPTIMFFLKADPKLANRNRIRQILILLARMMIILLLLLALSKPVFFNSVSTNGSEYTFIVIDNSASMGRVALIEENSTCLDIAKKAASSILDLIDCGKINILKTTDCHLDFERLNGNEQLSDIINSITVSNSASDIQGLLDKISTAYKGASKNIHIFTDLQKMEYSSLQQNRYSDCVIKIHQVLPLLESKSNVFIKSISKPQKVILPGQPIRLDVVLANNSSYDAFVKIELKGDFFDSISKNIEISALSSNAHTFELDGVIPGRHLVNLSITGDDFTQDNTAVTAILCQKPANALFGGDRGDFGLAPLALAPMGASQYSASICIFRANNRIKEYCQNNPVDMLVLTYAGAYELSSNNDQWLKNYIEKGGTLLLLPYTGSNQINDLPDFVNIEIANDVNLKQATSIKAVNPDTQFWYNIFKGRQLDYNDILIKRYYPLNVGPDVNTLLRSSTNDIVFAHRHLGDGDIFVSGLAFDLNWSELPKSPLIVVMLQNIVSFNNSNTEDGGIYTLNAGTSNAVIDSVAGPLEAVSLSGPNIRFKGLVKDLPIPVFTSAIQLKSDDANYLFCYNADNSEGISDYYDSIDFLKECTYSDVFCDVINLDTDYSKIIGTGSSSIALYKYLILLVVIFWIIETMLANNFRRRLK